MCSGKFFVLHRVVCLVTGCLALILMGSAAFAAERTSQLYVKGEVSLSDGGTVRFDLLEGAKLKIWDQGKPYDIIAKVLDVSNATVRFEVFDQATDEGQHLGNLEVMGSQLKAISGLDTAIGIEVHEVYSRDSVSLTTSKPTCHSKPQLAERLVVGRVELATGGVVTFRTPEGKATRITDPELGRSWELTPSVIEEENLRLHLELAEISTSGEALKRLLDPLEVEGALLTPAAEGQILVTVSDVRDVKQPTGEAMTVPTSSRLVHARLTVESDRVVDFIVREGELFTILDRKVGYYYGLVPDILNEAELDVRFRLYELTEYGSQLEGLKLIGHAGGTQLREPLPFAKKNLRVEVLEITPYTAIPYKEGAIRPKNQASQCCVECPGDKKTCGCKVEESCGSCCVEPCCSSLP